MRSDQIAFTHEGGKAGDTVEMRFNVKERFDGVNFLAEVLAVIPGNCLEDIEVSIDGSGVHLESRDEAVGGGYRVTRSTPDKPFEGVIAHDTIEIRARLKSDSGRILGVIFGTIPTYPKLDRRPIA